MQPESSDGNLRKRTSDIVIDAHCREVPAPAGDLLILLHPALFGIARALPNASVT